MTSRPAAAEPRSPDTLARIAPAMAVTIVALVAVAVVVRPSHPAPPPSVLTWGLAGLALGSLLVGVMLAVTSDPRAPGYPSRTVVSLALREACGLLGAVLTLAGGELAWALGLGGAAVVAILALRPRRPGA